MSFRSMPRCFPSCAKAANHLLERRTALAAALASLGATRETGTATPEEFHASTPLLAEG